MESIEATIENLFKTYKKQYRPWSDGAVHTSQNKTITDVHHWNSATKVDVEMRILSINKISIRNMELTMDILLTLRWRDIRLAYTSHAETIQIQYLKDKLWLPDLYFENAKYGYLHTTTQPNDLLWLYPSGHLIFVQKLSIRLSCPMNLRKFPFH